MTECMNGLGGTAAKIKKQEYDIGALKKAAKGKRKHFKTRVYDKALKRYVTKDAKGIIVGDIGLEWRRNSRGTLCWHPTHIPTEICFENNSFSSDIYEAYVAALSRINFLSENFQTDIEITETEAKT